MAMKAATTLLLSLLWSSIFVSGFVTDLDEDGFPDAVEYWNETEIFRDWARTVGYAIAVEPERFQTIVDCSSLVRFIFVESLKEHDTKWMGRIKPPVTFATRDLSKHYPYVDPLGENVFRIGADTFYTFASSVHLLQYNCFFVSRNLDEALPGDVLFYFHPAGHQMPYHTMMYLGEYVDGEAYVIYHTGPMEGSGEIKLVKVSTLRFKAPQQWRASETNPYFLGVYRWSMIYFNLPQTGVVQKRDDWGVEKSL
ncbi:MAG: hypothetical protein DRP27_07490 [Thermotogae bacterium]|mgnify:CR=1 FL=1|nr:MAG: hypothetical protein DRP27_07490 [Thermotogota bacterium]